MNVELRNIFKHFGKVQANNGISLTVKSGIIQGILGENGAGKSTLMKILSGFIQADSGEIVLDGKKVVIKDPYDAMQLGIGMLHQDPLDFPPMRVIDDLIIGSKGRIFPNKKSVIKRFETLQKQFGFSISVSTYVDTLTVGERQQLEILRLLLLGAEVLILDEPTTGISANQKDRLFEAVKKLSREGKAIIFVSHKLEEIEGLCHQVAVFRLGKNVGEVKPPYKTDKLVEMMFGKEIKRGNRVCNKSDQLLIEVNDLKIDDSRLGIEGVNFDVYRGEVIGLAGMEGSGQDLILRALSGIIRPVGGHIWLKEQKGKQVDLVAKNYFFHKKMGISFMPAARLEEGLIPGLSLTSHFILAAKQTGFFINQSQAVSSAERKIKEYNIKGTPSNIIESLSGGNQQRALLALLQNPLNLLLLEHPTRGLDIESTMYIWSKLKIRCEEGASILFISSDLDEVLHYSDRIIVFFGGKLSKAFDAAKVTVERLGELIGGKGWT